VAGVIDDYLNELRARLRGPAAERDRILAETQDHLRESVAASVAAGLTETQAQEAAINAFGSVRAVARAHTRHRGWLADAGLVVWKLGWLSLLGIAVADVAQAWVLRRVVTASAVIASGPDRGTVIPGGPSASHQLLVQAAIMLAAGLVLASGYAVVRHRRGALLGGYFPLVAAAFFLVGAPTSFEAAGPNSFTGLAFAAAGTCLAVGYAIRMAGTLVWRRLT
jgi:hypothetical protein